MSLVIIPEKGSFDTDDILFLSVPNKRFASSQLAIEISIKGFAQPITLEASQTITQERIYEIHEKLTKEWKKQRDLISL